MQNLVLLGPCHIWAVVRIWSYGRVNMKYTNGITAVGWERYIRAELEVFVAMWEFGFNSRSYRR